MLANDTAGTIAMVEELWGRVNRPNVMIKIPGTKEGLPAIEESIYRGYNINVTLIFSVEMYEKAARAYIKGLQRRAGDGKPVDKIRSVNSVFVSRIDTVVDKMLQNCIAKGDKARSPFGQGRHRQPEADLSKVQGALRGRRLRAAAGRRCRRAASAVGLDLDEEPALSRLDVRRNGRRTGYGQHDAADDARSAARSRHGRARHRRDRPARSDRRDARPAGRKNLALRGHARICRPKASSSSPIRSPRCSARSSTSRSCWPRAAPTACTLPSVRRSQSSTARSTS